MPSVLPPQAPADPPAVRQPMPTPHQLRIQQWQQAPPQQWPRGLPATITILTPDLLTGPEAAEGHHQLLVEVGVGFDFWVKRKGGAHVFSQLLLFFFTSHLVLQSCRQRANELVGLSMELHYLQHWSQGASSEELLLWMRSQHWGKALPPLAPVSSYTNCYLCTCILLLAGCTSSLFFCRAGLIWRSWPPPSRWNHHGQELSSCWSPCFQ